MKKRIINLWEHNGWSNNVYFEDFEDRRIVGFLLNRPVKGDEIREKMKSGKIARFRIIKIKYMNDPDDMFFATVSDIGYLGEKEPNSINSGSNYQT